MKKSGHRLMRILSLDPSVMNRLGWATLILEWDENGNRVREEWNFGSFEISGMNFKMRCRDAVDWILQLEFYFDILVCEWPMFYENQRGNVAARQGYTINLAGIVMFIAGFFRVHHKNLFLYTAPDWKGTTPKHVTARRFFKMFDINEMQVDHDTIDACMMLVYHCRKQKLTT